MKNALVHSQNTKKRLLLLAALVIAAAAAVLIALRAAPAFQGSLVKNPDEFRLDIRRMNGIDSHVLTLKTSDTLRVHFKTDSGRMKLEILAPDGSSLYSGNSDGTNGSDFDLNLPADGDYQINVTGERASGELLVQAVR